MPQEKVQITHRYLFTQGELMELLKLQGDKIIDIKLWRGLSPDEEAIGVSPNKVVFYIDTQEGEIDPEKW
jgi:hypothetical protein